MRLVRWQAVFISAQAGKVLFILILPPYLQIVKMNIQFFFVMAFYSAS